MNYNGAMSEIRSQIALLEPLGYELTEVRANERTWRRIINERQTSGLISGQLHSITGELPTHVYGLKLVIKDSLPSNTFEVN